MRKSSVALAVLSLATGMGLTTLFAPSTAEAAIVCRARMSGEATGFGVFGVGTQQARQSAMTNWSTRVAARYGSRFANSALARSVTYDCRQGGITQAKCVVAAIPCADIPAQKRPGKRRPRR